MAPRARRNRPRPRVSCRARSSPPTRRVPRRPALCVPAQPVDDLVDGLTARMQGDARELELVGGHVGLLSDRESVVENDRDLGVDGARRWRASARRCTRSTTEALRCRAQQPPTASRHNAVRGWKPESRSRSLPSARHVRMIRRRHGACPARRTAEVTEDRPSRGGCPESCTPPVPRRHRDTPPGGRRAPRGRSATRHAQHPRSPAPAAGGACGR